MTISEGKELEADNVICNADPPGVYEKLLTNKKENAFFNWKKTYGLLNGFICLLFWNKKSL